MKRLHLLLALCSIFLYAFADTDDVSNVTVYQEGQNIIIEYDLAMINEIIPYVSVNGGTYVKLNNVIGDVGENVIAGHGRIEWDVLSQFDKFDYSNVLFKIETGITSVKDICGNTYSVVKIGNQYWMAENIKCDKYDTHSEAYNNGKYNVFTSSIDEYSPYYIDATDITKWDYNGKKCSTNLSKEKIIKLGYLYNWAAAVGAWNGRYCTTPFKGKRQGVCPNGWHVPAKEEWQMLANHIDSNNGYINAGAKMKTTSGWYENCNGTDSYGFAALPSGSAKWNKVNSVGCNAAFWTSTPDENDEIYAYHRCLGCGYDAFQGYRISKNIGMSVRCVKD